MVKTRCDRPVASVFQTEGILDLDRRVLSYFLSTYDLPSNDSKNEIVKRNCSNKGC